MIHPFIRDHSKEFPGFHPQIHRPSGFLKQRFSHFTDLEKEGVGMTSFKEETNSEIESMANGFAGFLFFWGTHQAGLRLTVTQSNEQVCC